MEHGTEYHKIDCSNNSDTLKQLAEKLEKLGKKKPRCHSLITTKYRAVMFPNDFYMSGD